MNIIKKTAYLVIIIQSAYCCASLDNADLPGTVSESPQLHSQIASAASMNSIELSAHRASLEYSPQSSNTSIPSRKNSTPPLLQLDHPKEQRNIFVPARRSSIPSSVQCRLSLSGQQSNKRNLTPSPIQRRLNNQSPMPHPQYKSAFNRPHAMNEQLQQAQSIPSNIQATHQRTKTNELVETLPSADSLPASRGIIYNPETNKKRITYDRNQEKIKNMFGIQDEVDEQTLHDNCKDSKTQETKQNNCLRCVIQ
ncbi:MAG: hypothetical protein P4L31_06280 [Candidatus Babeliales bacterium]|nr:hypothetical protein [Candidatus Babeliales bacterium]